MYYVQFGIFKKFENAHSFQQLAERYDLNSEMSYDGTFFHIVNLQSFEDKAFAILVKIFSELLLEGYLFVVKKNDK